MDMDKAVFDFLKKEHVCALTIMIDGQQPHAAAMHFSHTEDPLELYFSTDLTTRKAMLLNSTKSTKAAFVAGFSEEEWITVQINGDIHLVEDTKEVENIKKVHYEKNPGSQKFEDIPTTCFLKLEPSWLRLINFNTDPMVTHEYDQFDSN